MTSRNLTGDADLLAVTGPWPQNAWAVGYINPTSSNPQCGAAIFHWTGAAWALVPSADLPSSYLNAFPGVVAISARDARAVGTTDYAETPIAHGNGAGWTNWSACLADAPQRPDAGDNVVWIYAVVADQTASRLAELAGVSGEPVRTVTATGLSAVVGTVGDATRKPLSSLLAAWPRSRQPGARTTK